MGTGEMKESAMKISDRPEGQLRNWWYGVSSAAHLKDCSPYAADGGAGNGVNLNQAIGIEPHAVHKAQIRESVSNAASLMGAVASKHAIELARLVQDGKAANGEGVGVVPLVGFFACNGNYFWVDTEGVYTVDQLAAHGRIGPLDRDELKGLIPYLKKYMFKRIGLGGQA